MAQPIEISDDVFESSVIKSEVPVLVDFWAEWCSPCRMIAPSLKQLASEYGEDVLKVVKVDVDSNPATPGMYGIVGIPTLMLFKDGQVVERITGALPKNAIEAKIRPHLNLTA